MWGSMRLCRCVYGNGTVYVCGDTGCVCVWGYWGCVAVWGLVRLCKCMGAM